MADAHGNHNPHHQHQQTFYLPSQSQPNTLPDHSHLHQNPHQHQHTALPTPPLVGYNSYQYASTYASDSTSPTTPTTGATARGSPYGTATATSRINPLHRGEACLTCRRRKMKCDAGKPCCGPCSRQGKADECEYEESRFLAQIARLETEVAQLRARIRELEGTPDPAPSSSSSGSVSGNPTNLPSGAGSPESGRPLHVGEFDYAQSQSPSQSHSQTGYTPYMAAQTQTSNVRRSPGQEGIRTASGFGYDGQQQQQYSQQPQQHYARPQGQHTPSPQNLTPSTELNPEVFGRM
ncbi:hypothetical protein BKA62DRAFT_814362 [Auriculariales sp. MPI-PUGE-AT-0066]|nr:hypothetical protein BKA62DRAFT_814362 [Auriculariales sp. MPI-PUGE-AT-0066]